MGQELIVPVELQVYTLVSLTSYWIIVVEGLARKIV